MLQIDMRTKHQEINSRELRLLQKEEDLNQEVQTLLNTIDDYKKVNQRLNKHYQKRFKNIERDLVQLQNMIIDQNGGFVGYNGIVIGGATGVGTFGKQPLISQRQGNLIGQQSFIGLQNNNNENQTSRNLLINDKSSAALILNSHRQGGLTLRNTLANNLNLNNTTTIPNLTPIQLQLNDILQRLRNQIVMKVRLKDPLDENGAHLIPSSRIFTQRTNNFLQNNNGFLASQQTGRTLNKCKSSARLDQAFVQNTSRSNLNNLASTRGIGGLNNNNLNMRSGGQLTTRRQNNNGNNQGLEVLCETCLTNEYSMYSIEEEIIAANKENQNDQQQQQHQQVNQTLIKEYLGGKDPNDLTLSERDKLLSKILMKDYESKQLQDAQHVKWQDILNYQAPQKLSRATPLQPIQYTEKSESHASQQPLQLDSRKSSENFNKFIHDLSAIPALKNHPSSSDCADDQLFQDQNCNHSFKEDLEDLSMITADNNQNHLQMKSFDNSFTLADQQIIQSQKSSACAGPVQSSLNQIDTQQQHQQQKKGFKVPALNLDKIKNQQNDFFKNNIKDQKQLKQSQLQQQQQKQQQQSDLQMKKVMFDYKNVKLNDNSSFLSNNNDNIDVEQLQIANDQKQYLNNHQENDVDQTLNLEDSIIIEQQQEKEQQQAIIDMGQQQQAISKPNKAKMFSFGESLVLSPIQVNDTSIQNENLMPFSNTTNQKSNKNQSKLQSFSQIQTNHKPTPYQQQHQHQNLNQFFQSDLQQTYQVLPSDNNFQDLKQKLEYHFVNFNLQKDQETKYQKQQQKGNLQILSLEDSLSKTFKRSRQVQKLGQDSSTNKLIQNLDDLFNPTKHDSDINDKNYSDSQNKSLEETKNNNNLNKTNSDKKKKIIIKRGDIQMRKNVNSNNSNNTSNTQNINKNPSSQSSQSQSQYQQRQQHQQQQQIFFNKPGNESVQSNNFTLGPQDQSSSSTQHHSNNFNINNNDFTIKDSFDKSSNHQNIIINNNNQSIGNVQVKAINQSLNSNGNSLIQKVNISGRQQSAKNRPIIAKQINSLFSNQAINTSVQIQRQGNKSQVSNQGEGVGNSQIMRLRIPQKYPTTQLTTIDHQENDFSKDLIQLTEYLTLTNQIPKTQQSHNNINNINHQQHQSLYHQFYNINNNSSASPKLLTTTQSQLSSQQQQQQHQQQQQQQATQLFVKQNQQQQQLNTNNILKIKPNQSFKLESISFSNEEYKQQTQSNNSNIININNNSNNINITSQIDKINNVNANISNLVIPKQNISVNKISLSKLKIKNLKPINHIQAITAVNNTTSLTIGGTGACINNNDSYNTTTAANIINNTTTNNNNKLDQSSVILTQPVLIKRPIMKINKAQIVSNNSNSNNITRNLVINNTNNSNSEVNTSNNNLSQILNKSKQFNANKQQQGVKQKQNQQQQQLQLQLRASIPNTQLQQQLTQDDQTQKPQLSHRYLMRRGINKAAATHQQQQEQIQTQQVYQSNQIATQQQHQPLNINMNMMAMAFPYKSQTPKNNNTMSLNNQSLINAQIQQQLMQMNQTININNKSVNSGNRSANSLYHQQQQQQQQIQSSGDKNKKDNDQQYQIQQKTKGYSKANNNSTNIINNARLKILRNRASGKQQQQSQQQQIIGILNNSQQQQKAMGCCSSSFLSNKSSLVNSARVKSNSGGGSSSHRLSQTYNSNNNVINNFNNSNTNYIMTFYNDLNNTQQQQQQQQQHLRFHQTQQSKHMGGQYGAIRSHREFSNSNSKKSKKSSSSKNQSKNNSNSNSRKQLKGAIIVNNNNSSNITLNNTLLQTSNFNPQQQQQQQQQQSARSQGSRVNSARRNNNNNNNNRHQSFKNLR